MNLAEAKHIYFLGIGGIGMSALARYFLGLGKQVSGYDRSPSRVTDSLQEAGARVFFEENETRPATTDLIIYTPALPAESLEMQVARASGVPMIKRSEALGLITRSYQTLAIGGTHGKTTTSVMTAWFLRQAGVDATAFLGGISKNLNGNFVQGTSPWCIAEADEFDRSFLRLLPAITLITSTDADHLDIYGSAEHLWEGYRQFAAQSLKLLVEVGLAHLPWPQTPLTYGIEAGDFRAAEVQVKGLETHFRFEGPGIQLSGLRLQAAGRHNLLNAVGALALSTLAGADIQRLEAAVATYEGIARRFEVHVNTPALAYVDDYAHHPSEIEAALQAARAAFPGRQVVVVFQPHLYSRTRDFAEGFQASLSKADALVMMEIYPAREQPLPGVTSQELLKGIPRIPSQMAAKGHLPDALEAVVQLPAAVLTLGAGDIDREVGSVKQWALHRCATLSAQEKSKTEKP